MFARVFVLRYIRINGNHEIQGGGSTEEKLLSMLPCIDRSVAYRVSYNDDLGIRRI